MSLTSCISNLVYLFKCGLLPITLCGRYQCLYWKFGIHYLVFMLVFFHLYSIIDSMQSQGLKFNQNTLISVHQFTSAQLNH